MEKLHKEQLQNMYSSHQQEIEAMKHEHQEELFKLTVSYPPFIYSCVDCAIELLPFYL